MPKAKKLTPKQLEILTAINNGANLLHLLKRGSYQFFLEGSGVVSRKSCNSLLRRGLLEVFSYGFAGVPVEYTITDKAIKKYIIKKPTPIKG